MLKQKEVYLVDLGYKRTGCEEAGRRPCLIVSSPLHNTVNHSVIVIPLTTQTNKLYWAEHEPFNYDEGVLSVAMCEHIREVDKSRVIGECLGVVDDVVFDCIRRTLIEVTLGDLSLV